MSKAEKVQNHLKSADEPKKWKAYVIVAVGVLVGVGLLFGVIWFADVDEYLQDNKQIINLYDFYSKDHSNSTNVYLVGSSQIGRAVYTPLVNQILQDEGYNISVFSLSVDSDLPIQRLTELQEIINSNPTLIIWGVSYRDFYNKKGYDSTYYLPDERFKLTHGKVKLTDGAREFYSQDFLDSLDRLPGLFYYKTFITSSYRYKFGGNKSNINYTVDNYDYNYRIANTKSTSLDALKKQTSQITGYWKNEVDINSENRYAFDYMIKEFNKQNIPVIVLSMPLHPLLSDTFTTKSIDNYFQILNETGVAYYDYEALFADASDFSDMYHMSFSGAQKFSPLIADLIIQELS